MDVDESWDDATATLRHSQLGKVQPEQAIDQEDVVLAGGPNSATPVNVLRIREAAGIDLAQGGAVPHTNNPKTLAQAAASVSPHAQSAMVTASVWLADYVELVPKPAVNNQSTTMPAESHSNVPYGTIAAIGPAAPTETLEGSTKEPESAPPAKPKPWMHTSAAPSNVMAAPVTRMQPAAMKADLLNFAMTYPAVEKSAVDRSDSDSSSQLHQSAGDRSTGKAASAESEQVPKGAKAKKPEPSEGKKKDMEAELFLMRMEVYFRDHPNAFTDEKTISTTLVNMKEGQAS
ncbi:hypothetical protein FRC06_005110, partial [Ceratobasidium sp. 370]